MLLSSCLLFNPAKGKVVLSINCGSGGKTILPEISVASYLISFSGPVSHGSESTTQASLTIELEAGTWTISVEGRDSGGATVAVGSTSGVEVSAGATTSATVVLSAQTSGSGSIDVTVNWPTDVSPAIDVCEVTLDDIAVPPTAVTFTPGGSTARYMEAKAAGSYRLCINLKSNSGTLLSASVQEAVQVYGNLCSSATIGLGAGDFNGPPEAPSGLSVAEGLGRLVLSWVDNSRVETGYVVERGTTETGPFGVLDDSLASNTVSYIDSTAVTGTTYWYRVKAKNSFGDSGYSDTASGKVEAPAPGGGGALTFSDVTASSIRVNWQKATDNTSAQTALEYKVVRSLSNNIGTVEDAEAHGTLVMDWTADVATANATGLNAGTQYYFIVLVRDSAGNKGAYVSSPQSTENGTGFLDLSIVVTTPQNETITFNQTDNFVVAPDSTLSVKVSESFDSYSWILDGDTVDGQTTATVSIACGTLVLGVHHLSAFVTKNGLLYSATVRFRIEN